MVSAQPTSADRSDSGRPLAHEAGFELNPYANNAFRVLGLTVAATDRDIRRRSHELLLTVELRGGDQAQQERIRKAAASLEDSVTRLREELYWPNLVPQPVPPTIELADIRTVSSAMQSLATLAEAGSEQAVHDLAVLGHAAVIENEADDLDQWKYAIVRWHEVWVNKAFWFRMSLRAEGFKDPRASNAVVDALRDDLPKTVLAPSASRIARMVDASHDSLAAQHLLIVVASGFPVGDIERVRSAATEGLRSRIRASMASIEDSLTATDKTVGTPSPAVLRTKLLEAWAEFQREVLPLVVRLPHIDSGNTALRLVGDQAAAFAQSLGVRLHNQVDDSAAGIPPLEAAVRLAASDSVRQQATENLGILRFRVGMRSAVAFVNGNNWKAAIGSAETALAIATTQEQRQAAAEVIERCKAALQRRNRRLIGWSVAAAAVGLIILASAIASASNPGNPPIQPSDSSNPASIAPANPCLADKQALRSQLDSMNADLQNLNAQIDSVNARMDAYSRQGDTNNYNALVPLQNSLVRRYETERSSYNSKVNQYNAMSC
jgi:hypothetical protein